MLLIRVPVALDLWPEGEIGDGGPPPRRPRYHTAVVWSLAAVALSAVRTVAVRCAGVEDYTFNLQTASNIIAPPTITGELLKLDKVWAPFR
jgi:hypothetical protein